MKTYTLLVSFFLCLQFAAAQPSEDGLILWLPFNGNANDESNNNHSASVYGTVLTEDRHGNPDAAYSFDGIDDYMLVPDHPDLRLGQTSYTISLWTKIDHYDEWTHAFLSKRFGPGSQGYMVQVIGADHPFGLQTGSVNMVISGGSDPSFGTTNLVTEDSWHHIVYYFDHEAGLAQFFIDNMADAQAQLPSPNGGVSEHLYIGKDNYTGYFFLQGALDDIRIYKRKLSRSEIGELFNEGLNPANEPADGFAISIQPTLANEFINVLSENIDIQSFIIHDSSGRILQKAGFLAKIDCRHLPPGSYTISFFGTQGNLLKAEKFVKL